MFSILSAAVAISLAGSIVSSVALAQDVLSFRPDLVEASGVACSFQDSAAGPANAFLVVQGTEVSIIFTQLGSIFQTSGSGAQQSGCRVSLPAEVAQQHYVSDIGETLTYGIVKTAGVSAEIRTSSNYARRQPNGKSLPSDLMRNFVGSSTVFSAGQNINDPLVSLRRPLVQIKPGNGNGPYARMCGNQRLRTMNFIADAQILVNKENPAGNISISIDGLDLKYIVSNAVKPCGRN